MKKILKVLLLLLFLAMIAGAVASYLSKKRFESMTDDEIRAMLAAKLGDRVSEDQLASIQDSVVAGVRARRSRTEDHYVEDVQEAVEELTEVALEVEEAEESAGASPAEAGEKATEMIEAIKAVNEDADD
jgi:Na+-transporting NADH:ubiquinone oxidoreductase subunit NqrC